MAPLATLFLVGSSFLQITRTCLNDIIIKSLDPLIAKKTFIRKKLGHTMVSALKPS